MNLISNEEKAGKVHRLATEHRKRFGAAWHHCCRGKRSHTNNLSPWWRICKKKYFASRPQSGWINKSLLTFLFCLQHSHFSKIEIKKLPHSHFFKLQQHQPLQATTALLQMLRSLHTQWKKNHSFHPHAGLSRHWPLQIWALGSSCLHCSATVTETYRSSWKSRIDGGRFRVEQQQQQHLVARTSLGETSGLLQQIRELAPSPP